MPVSIVRFTQILQHDTFVIYLQVSAVLTIIRYILHKRTWKRMPRFRTPFHS